MIVLKIYLLLSCLLSPLVFAAQAPSAREISDLAPAQIFGFFPSVDAPVVGKPYRVFVHALVGFSPKQELVPEFTLDGAVVSAVQTTPSLWILNLGVFHEIKSHALAAKVYLRDSKEAAALLEAERRNNLAISEIDAALSGTTDPQEVANLLAQKAEKERYALELQNNLLALRVLLKTEAFSFQVGPDPTNDAYPNATAVSPQFGPSAGGTTITITGTNFPVEGANPVVRIGGRACAFISRTSTSITAKTRVFPSPGIKDLEVVFSGQPRKNTILTDAFFVTNP